MDWFATQEWEDSIVHQPPAPGPSIEEIHFSSREVLPQCSCRNISRIRQDDRLAYVKFTLSAMPESPCDDCDRANCSSAIAKFGKCSYRNTSSRSPFLILRSRDPYLAARWARCTASKKHAFLYLAHRGQCLKFGSIRNPVSGPPRWRNFRPIHSVFAQTVFLQEHFPCFAHNSLTCTAVRHCI